jgi:hypothetical protein
MDPFWSHIYDDCKDRRYGRLFLVTILIACGLLLPVAALSANLSRDELQEIGLALLPGIALVTAALVWRWIRYGRKSRQERLKYSNLSRDELAKARSKLKNQMKLVKFKTETRSARRAMTPRKPDTNLKY